jgi:hypothetical protein
MAAILRAADEPGGDDECHGIRPGVSCLRGPFAGPSSCPGKRRIDKSICQYNHNPIALPRKNASFQP